MEVWDILEVEGSHLDCLRHIGSSILDGLGGAEDPVWLLFNLLASLIGGSLTPRWRLQSLLLWHPCTIQVAPTRVHVILIHDIIFAVNA